MDRAVRILNDAGLCNHALCLAASSPDREPFFYTTGNLEPDAALTPDTRMYAASVTKQLIAALVGMAVERGELTTDDYVARWIDPWPSWAGAVRVRHLIHHTSGLPAVAEVLLAVDGADEYHYDNAGIVTGIADAHGLRQPPGTLFEYSNVGYVCLAEVLRRACRLSLSELARRDVFEPLGMGTSSLGGPAPFVVAGYLAPPLSVGDGGWWVSSRDLLTWLVALNARAFGDTLAARIETPGSLDDGTPLPYAWGVNVTDLFGRRTITHGGNVPGWSAKTVRLPDHGIAVALLTTSPDVGAVSDCALQIADALGS